MSERKQGGVGYTKSVRQSSLMNRRTALFATGAFGVGLALLALGDCSTPAPAWDNPFTLYPELKGREFQRVPIDGLQSPTTIYNFAGVGLDVPTVRGVYRFYERTLNLGQNFIPYEPLGRNVAFGFNLRGKNRVMFILPDDVPTPSWEPGKNDSAGNLSVIAFTSHDSKIERSVVRILDAQGLSEAGDLFIGPDADLFSDLQADPQKYATFTFAIEAGHSVGVADRLQGVSRENITPVTKLAQEIIIHSLALALAYRLSGSNWDSYRIRASRARISDGSLPFVVLPNDQYQQLQYTGKLPVFLSV